MAVAMAKMRDGGIKIVPHKGDAIVFYNYDEDGVRDPRAVHSALPVTRGDKWVCNFWITLTPTELLSMPCAASRVK